MLAALLSKRLCSTLPWKTSRLECLGYLVVSILRNLTVNLVRLSGEASETLKSESCYRRFSDFLLRVAMPMEDMARLAVAKLPKQHGG